MCCFFFCYFFFNDTATTEIYTLSLHDALPISMLMRERPLSGTFNLGVPVRGADGSVVHSLGLNVRSEEHTSELQSPMYLVCRLLLEKKKTKKQVEQKR